MGVDAEPLVAIFYQWVDTIGRAKGHMEDDSANILGPNVMRGDPNRSPVEEKDAKRPISTSIMGNRHTTKLIQVFKLTLEFSIHSTAREMNIGVSEHCLTLCQGRGQTKEVLAKIGWNLRMKAKLLPPFDECPTPDHQLTMSIIIWIIWNSRRVLKPNFQNHVRELARNHNPAIMVIMETRLGRDGAREITDGLPFDGTIHIGMIRFTGDLWLL